MMCCVILSREGQESLRIRIVARGKVDGAGNDGQASDAGQGAL